MRGVLRRCALFVKIGYRGEDTTVTLVGSVFSNMTITAHGSIIVSAKAT